MVNRMEKVIIAVDAGGTKTKVVAINENKQIVYEITGGSGSPAVVGKVAIKNIFDLVQDVYDNVHQKYDVRYVQMGISGYGVLSDPVSHEKELESKLNVEVKMDSDTSLGLYSIIEDKFEEGVLVLSGTGSAVSGIKNNETMLVGGFGVLLTESGSSYTSVKQLIVNIINQYEDTMTYSKLGKDFMELLGAKHIGAFRNFMYTKTKTEIASYSKFISSKALEGDIEAISILKKAGFDLAIQTTKLYKNLKLSNDAIIGFRGSFVNKAPFVKEEFLKTLNEYGIKPIINEGDDDPIYGGYYMAKRKGKI